MLDATRMSGHRRSPKIKPPGYHGWDGRISSDEYPFRGAITSLPKPYTEEACSGSLVERQPDTLPGGLGGPFCNSISEISKMSPRFCNTPNAMDVGNNGVQVRAAAGSHHPPNPWPWPTRGAWAGTSCHQGRRGYRKNSNRLCQSTALRHLH